MKRSMLGPVKRARTGLQKSQRCGEIVRKVGFDWKTDRGVWRKLHEELGELDKEVRARRPSRARIEDELGDVLFCLANFARHLGLDAEKAALGGAAKFVSRFSEMERALAGKNLKKLRPAQWEAAWRNAKKNPRKASRHRR